jgi:hypothetical protein
MSIKSIKPCDVCDVDTRILRLEDEFSDLKASHAETTTELKHLSEQVIDSAVRITEKIDACIQPINERLNEGLGHLISLNEKVLEHDKFIGIALATKKAADIKRATWRKIAFALATGAGAVVVKELIVMFFRH